MSATRHIRQLRAPGYGVAEETAAVSVPCAAPPLPRSEPFPGPKPDCAAGAAA